MTDIHSKETRSYNMSRIKEKNTCPELLVRRYLYNQGFRYRINVNTLLGKPDIVLRKYKTVIFVNGCFWHGHKGCKYFIMPKTKTEWWSNKISKNKARDLKIQDKLKEMGWNIIIVWECELKKESKDKRLTALSEKLYSFLDK